jgi:glycolate oxidase iron-sulfur subunit
VAGPGDASSVRDQALLYVGCMANYMYTDVAAAAVKVLGAVGVRVRLPGEHACCGAPMDAAGDAAAALSQARKNLAILGDSGIPVLTICASGGVMLRERYRALVAGDKDLESVASRLAQRTMDLSAYLVHVVGVERIARAMQTKAAPLETRVTWHDPCHLARGQGVRSEPRELLRLAVGQRFVEMTDPDRCCGLAGTYFLAHPKTSRAIRERKSAAIEESGAGVVATACPGCMFQIQGGLADRPSQARVLHLAQILAMAMGKSLHTPAHPTGETT